MRKKNYNFPLLLVALITFIRILKLSIVSKYVVYGIKCWWILKMHIQLTCFGKRKSSHFCWPHELFVTIELTPIQFILIITMGYVSKEKRTTVRFLKIKKIRKTNHKRFAVRTNRRYELSQLHINNWRQRWCKRKLPLCEVTDLLLLNFPILCTALVNKERKTNNCWKTSTVSYRFYSIILLPAPEIAGFLNLSLKCNQIIKI